HVVGPGVVAEAFLVTDDRLAVRPLQREPGGRLHPLGPDSEPGTVPGRRLLLDRDPVAAGLVLEGVEPFRRHRQDELPREAAGLALAELVSRPVGERSELELADRHLRSGARRPEGAHCQHASVAMRLDRSAVLPAPLLGHLRTDVESSHRLTPLGRAPPVAGVRATLLPWHGARLSSLRALDDRPISSVLLEQIASLVAPPRCAACGSAPPSERTLCERCRDELATAPRVAGPAPPPVDAVLSASPLDG